MPGTKGRSGRKPKPTKMKLVEGNPGKRPINRNEPKPHKGKLSCPRWLDDEGRREWRRVIAELKRLGLVTVLDTTRLAQYCDHWSRYLQATNTLREDGLIKDGRKHPAATILKEAEQAMRSIASEFGMTPASRVNLKGPPEPSISIAERIRARRKKRESEE